MYNRYVNKQFASISWLSNHYIAQLPSITNYISRLPIYSGDQVLDIGCGIGFYMDYFLRMVGPCGKVVGLDHDQKLLSAASAKLQSGFFDNWELANIDIKEANKFVPNYNKIILFNCLSYFKNPKEIIKNIYKKMSPGSILFVKDFDMTTSSYNPINKIIHGDLIEGVKKATSASVQDNFINKFIGTNLHSIAKNISPHNSHSELWSFLSQYPFSAYQKHFIKETFKNSIGIAQKYCKSETIEYIYEKFIREEASFFTEKKSTFIENEHIVMIFA
jgi:2-polyprenyl-3-methyl-5-hydroxy-6-metoxy-1,4-benzoquinol methylase